MRRLIARPFRPRMGRLYLRIMANRQLTDRRALVTGASSGIGRALAIELARRGVDLVLCRPPRRSAGRSRRGSRRKLGRRAVCVVGDVTDPAARRRALDAARDELGGLDILINNAGVAAHGRFAEADPGRLRPIMEVNFFAPVEFIREALPLLREGQQPIVVNIGSILGERGCPHKSEYSASKFALHGFSEAVRPELARLGIDVLVVAAGPTESEHFDHAARRPRRTALGRTRAGCRPTRLPAKSSGRSSAAGTKSSPAGEAGCGCCSTALAPRLVDRIMSRYG